MKKTEEQLEQQLREHRMEIRIDGVAEEWDYKGWAILPLQPREYHFVGNEECQSNIEFFPKVVLPKALVNELVVAEQRGMTDNEFFDIMEEFFRATYAAGRDLSYNIVRSETPATSGV